MSSTSVCLVNECNDYSVLNEIKVIDAQKDTYKIRGSSLLQTINEVNSNRRIYSMAIGERFVETANEKIDKNRMLGEMDHPTITNIKDPAQLKRQMVVLYEKVCQKFTKMWIEGTNILGLVETTSNQHGIDMARMANIDGIPIGFSCRALGKVKPSNRGKNIVEVTEPAIFVTYDAVTDPSHKKAQLTDISSVITSSGELTKVCSAPISEQTAINESSLLLEFKDLFAEKVDPLKILLERFDSKTFGSKDIDEQKVVRHGKKTFDMILSEYLGTSDKITGKSSNPVYNESNVHDLMQDYAHTHKKEYTSYDRIADKIKKYLG